MEVTNSGKESILLNSFGFSFCCIISEPGQIEDR